MTQLVVVWILCFAVSAGAFSSAEDTHQIPPDHAHLEGVFISLFSKNNSDWALVKVSSVKGYGSGFRGSLSPNDTIEAQLPNGHSFSPGQIFSGHVQQGLSELMSSSSPTYIINKLSK